MADGERIKMTKLKLLGIGKSEKHNYYIFKKEQEFFILIRDLLQKLAYPKYVWDVFGRPIDKRFNEPEYYGEEDIKKYSDDYCCFNGNGYYVEIFFGKEKVFLIIISENDKQKELSEFINKYIKDE